MLENFGVLLRVCVPKISRSNMTMNIIQLESTVTRCNCPSLPKNKLQHTLVGRRCLLYWEDLLLSSHQSCPSVFKCVVQKAGVDNVCGRKRGEFGKQNQNSSTKDPDKESWVWSSRGWILIVIAEGSCSAYAIVSILHELQSCRFISCWKIYTILSNTVLVIVSRLVLNRYG